jgi:hypothetical protein
LYLRPFLPHTSFLSPPASSKHISEKPPLMVDRHQAVLGITLYFIAGCILWSTLNLIVEICWTIKCLPPRLRN